MENTQTQIINQQQKSSITRNFKDLTIEQQFHELLKQMNSFDICANSLDFSNDSLTINEIYDNWKTFLSSEEVKMRFTKK